MFSPAMSSQSNIWNAAAGRIESKTPPVCWNQGILIICMRHGKQFWTAKVQQNMGVLHRSSDTTIYCVCGFRATGINTFYKHSNTQRTSVSVSNTTAVGFDVTSHP